MTPSIHLVRIKVSGWKGIKEAAEIEFGDTAWLVHGANEAGKSSLFSALRFALFEYSAKGGAFSDGWVNNDSTQAEVEVELQIGGAPFTIEKIRDHKKNGRTRLYDGYGASRRERTAKNKDADNEILQLIGASARRGREAETPSNWGILAWLLAPQAMNTIAEARGHATQALGLGKAISPEFQNVKAKIDDFCKANYGKTGNARQSSQLRQASQIVEDLEHNKAAIEEQRKHFDNALLELTRLNDRLPDLKEHLETVQANYDEARGEEADTAAEEQGLETLSAKIDSQESKAKRAADLVQTMADLDEEVAGFQDEMTESSQQIGEFETRERRAKSDFLGVRDKVVTLTVQLDSDAETIARNQSWVESAQHFDAIEALERMLEEVDAVQRELEDVERVGPVLTHATINGRVDLAAKLERAESLLASLANQRGVKVSVDGHLDATWVRDGMITDYTDELGFASRLEVKAADFTLIISQEGQEGAIGWVQQRLDLQQELHDLGAETTRALREEMADQRQRTLLHQELRTKLKKLGDADMLATKSARLRAMKIAPVPDDAPSIASIKAETQEVLDENKTSRKRLEALRSSEGQFAAAAAVNGRDLQTARAKKQSASDQLTAAIKRRDKEVEKAGVARTRVQVLNETNAVLEHLKTDLEKATEELDATKGMRSLELKRLLRVVRSAERDLRDAQSDIGSCKRRATELGEQGLQESVISVCDQLLVATEEHARVERRSEAYKRLGARLGEFVAGATNIETSPVRDRVQEWLRRVTEGYWSQIDMDASLEVIRLHGRPPAIDGESMASVGLRQVIHALTRLAVAVKIHKDGRAQDPNYPPATLVMDESLSHVDRIRVKRLMHVFNEQIDAGAVQVVALSHRRDEFQNLSAMNYDIKRRQAYDLDAD